MLPHTTEKVLRQMLGLSIDGEKRQVAEYKQLIVRRNDIIFFFML
jgi:hypothetical protein